MIKFERKEIEYEYDYFNFVHLRTVQENIGNATKLVYRGKTK